MNVNFEAIEKAWFKPKKTVLDELEEWLRKKSKGRLEYTNFDEVLDKIQELKKEMK